MSKERLKEIRDRFNKSSIFADTKDINWLIEQVEHAQKLENELQLTEKALEGFEKVYEKEK